VFAQASSLATTAISRLPFLVLLLSTVDAAAQDGNNWKGVTIFMVVFGLATD
jgi:hypothetical protein